MEQSQSATLWSRFWPLMAFRLVTSLECNSFSRSQYFRDFVGTAIRIFVLLGILTNL